MHQNRPTGLKREEYRKYLERTGILDALTKLLSTLYEEQEKPSDGLKFIYKYFGESFPDVFKPSAELEEERAKVKLLTEEVEELKARIAALEAPKTAVPEKIQREEPKPSETASEAPVVAEDEPMTADSSVAAL